MIIYVPCSWRHLRTKPFLVSVNVIDGIRNTTYDVIEKCVSRGCNILAVYVTILVIYIAVSVSILGYVLISFI